MSHYEPSKWSNMGSTISLCWVILLSWLWVEAVQLFTHTVEHTPPPFCIYWQIQPPKYACFLSYAPIIPLRTYWKMSEKVRKQSRIPPFTPLSRSTPRVNGVCSGLRPILHHPSLDLFSSFCVWFCWQTNGNRWKQNLGGGSASRC